MTEKQVNKYYYKSERKEDRGERWHFFAGVGGDSADLFDQKPFIHTHTNQVQFNPTPNLITAIVTSSSSL